MESDFDWEGDETLNGRPCIVNKTHHLYSHQKWRQYQPNHGMCKNNPGHVQSSYWTIDGKCAGYVLEVRAKRNNTTPELEFEKFKLAEKEKRLKQSKINEDHARQQYAQEKIRKKEAEERWKKLDEKREHQRELERERGMESVNNRNSSPVSSISSSRSSPSKYKSGDKIGENSYYVDSNAWYYFTANGARVNVVNGREVD